MITRVPGAPPARSASSWGAIALVIAVAVGVWLLSGREPGTGTGAGEPIPGASDGATYVGTTEPAPEPAEPAEPAGPADDPDSGLPYVELADLPREAVETVDLIDAGGPFPYAKDGSTFGNFEGILPDRQRGYYAEYTVETPGSGDRGARRIVAGDQDELYWTEDHYDSFERIRR